MFVGVSEAGAESTHAAPRSAVPARCAAGGRQQQIGAAGTPRLPCVLARKAMAYSTRQLGHGLHREGVTK